MVAVVRTGLLHARDHQLCYLSHDWGPELQVVYGACHLGAVTSRFHICRALQITCTGTVSQGAAFDTASVAFVDAVPFSPGARYRGRSLAIRS